MATIERINWKLATSYGFDLFTDHHNLIFLLDPFSVAPDLSQTSLQKFLCWDVKLSTYNYTCMTYRESITSVLTFLVVGMSTLPFVVWIKFRFSLRHLKYILNGHNRLSFRINSGRTVLLVHLIWNSSRGYGGIPTVLFDS